jgi:hypothetical protein
MSGTPTTATSSIGPKLSRPSETNKFVTSLMFSLILATAAYVIFSTSTDRLPFRVPAYLGTISFFLSFVFSSLFQVIRGCPYNPVGIVYSSGGITAFVLLTLGILSVPFVGTTLIWIVESAFPFIPDPTKPVQEENPALYSDKDRHVFSHAYAYWMFWAGVLPMYTILGFIGAC